jgi:hypothetical protein
VIGITLEQVLDAALDARVASMWSALPGRVLAWSPTGTCSVQPFPATIIDGEETPLPALADVPIAYPAGAGGSITYPLEAGDYVLLIFSSSPLARFRSSGAEGDQGETRRFDLSDAWCIPMAGGAALTSATDRVTIGQPSALDAKVQVGATPVLPPTPPVQVPAIADPIVPPLAPGFRQPSGRAARTGDTIKIVVDQPTIEAFVAGMAAIAAGAPVTPFDMVGVIASGSDVVEVK